MPLLAQPHNLAQSHNTLNYCIALIFAITGNVIFLIRTAEQIKLGIRDQLSAIFRGHKVRGRAQHFTANGACTNRQTVDFQRLAVLDANRLTLTTNSHSISG
jgi:hypothetical protein